MKKLWILFMLLPMFLFVVSCEKENQLSDNSIQNGSVSNPEECSLGKYKREISISDETGQNTLFLAIHSDYESAIDEYLSEHELKLIATDKTAIDQLKAVENSKKLPQPEETKDAPTISPEHSVIVEIVRSNIAEGTYAYSIDVTKKANMLKDFQVGTYADYISSSDFGGVVHRGPGYDIYVSTNYKNSFLSSWVNVYSGYLYAQPSGLYYAYVNKPNSYRVAFGVYLDARQSTQNYHLTFTTEDFYSRNCLLGTYDYNNYGECYVGTTPVGTTPFIYAPPGNPTARAFYHMPLSGNQCPLPGSWFDGYSCYVVAIPVAADPYTWSRNMLIKSNLIF